MAETDFSRMFSGSSPILANLAPIPVINPAVGGQLNIAPVSAVQALSARPELVMAGLGQGMESIAKGYFGGIMQKKQDAKDEIERKRKTDLEERRMKVEEGRFNFEKDKYEKERQDRLAAVGADKFPGESRSTERSPGDTEPTATPTTEPSESTRSSSGLSLVGNVFPAGSFTGEEAPFQKEKYSREVNTFRFSPEQAFEQTVPAKPLEVVPKPLTQGAPAVAPSNVLAGTQPVPAIYAAPKLTPAQEMESRLGLTVGKTMDPFGLYGKEAEAFKQMTPEQQRAYLAFSQPHKVDFQNSLLAKTGRAVASAYEGVKNWVNEPYQPSQEESLAIEQANKPVAPVAENQKPSEAAAPQASYRFPEEQWKRLQEATSSENLKELSPYITASADTGDMSTDQPKALPPTLPVPEKKQELYPLDLSQMYGIQYKEQPKPTTDQQPQAAQKAPEPADRFTIPSRPTANQIPKDFSTRDYEAARQEQAKDYGFYYEPMGRIETHKDANGQWYKVVRDPEKTSILEQKLGRLESMRQRYDKFKLQEQNTIDREQTKFYSNPDIKAFTAPNGMRQSFARFVKDYDAILKNPEASGISDIGLLDMFGRAEGGGRITEGQAALALRAVGILDKPDLLIQKLQGGAKLSQNQRDQMLRVITEDHAAQANLANQQIAMVRQKLQRQGVTDETMLPQPYIIPITKWDFEEKSKQVRAMNTQLQLQKTEALRNNDQDTVDQINQQLTQLKEEMDPLYKLAKKAPKDKDGNILTGILNAHDIEHIPQGWAGGAVATFQQQEP